MNKTFFYLIAMTGFMIPNVGFSLEQTDLPPQEDMSITTNMDSICKRAALHYEKKDIPDKDIVGMFEQIAKNGHPCGTMWLARLHSKGRCSLPKQLDTAQKLASSVIEKVMALSEKGDTEAQFLMGSAYQEGLAVTRNFTKAIQLYTTAASNGHITAINNLGVMSAFGQGQEPDIEKARTYFQKAAQKGSQLAAQNVYKFAKNDRNDSDRLKKLRSNTLTQALGMMREPGIAFLVKKGLISDAKGFIEGEEQGLRQFHFKSDGIVINIDETDRITVVEGHAKGSRDSEQFRGDLPMGLSWNDTRESASKSLGRPDDQGYVEGDEAYGMAYQTENVCFAVMFIRNPYILDPTKKTLQLWRIYEKWAVKYPEVAE